MLDYELFNVTDDHCYNIARALNYCKACGEDGLKFTNGIYHLYPEKASVRAVSVSNHDICGYTSIAMLLEDMKDFTIDGGDSLFVSHGVMITAAVINCENVTLRNFRFTVCAPMRMEAVVTDCNEKYCAIEVVNDVSYYIRDGRLRFTDGYGHDDPYHYTMMMCRNGETGYMPETKQSFDKNLRFTQLEGRSMRLDNLLLEPEPDMKLILGPQLRHGCTVFLEHCKNSLIENTSFRHSYAMGIIAQLCDTVTVHGISVKPEDSGFSTNCDATHFVSCTGRIEVSDSYFEAMLDDAMNVHGIFTRIEMIEDDGILVRDMHPGSKGLSLYRPEDIIAVMNPKKLVSESSYTVDSVEMINQEYVFLKLREPTTYIQEGHVVENMSIMPEVIFKNNTVKDNRARGILLASRGRITVEGNRFHTPGCAILFESDGEMWYESGGTEEVMIKNNLFDNCGYARGEWGSAVIEIKPRKDFDGINYYHRHIAVKNNFFRKSEKLLFSAADTKNIEFVDNIVPRDTYMTSYENCKNITETNNVIGVFQPEPINLSLVDIAQYVGTGEKL